MIFYHRGMLSDRNPGLVLVSAWVVCIFAGCSHPPTRWKEPEMLRGIPICTNETQFRKATKGLLVLTVPWNGSISDAQIPLESVAVPAAGENAGRFRLIVSNLYSEEILLGTDGYSWLGHLKAEHSGAGCGSLQTIPSRFKRLAKCPYFEGSPAPCGCCVADIPAAMNMTNWNAKEDVGKTLYVELVLYGMFRRNGQYFYGEVVIPVRLVE